MFNTVGLQEVNPSLVLVVNDLFILADESSDTCNVKVTMTYSYPWKNKFSSNTSKEFEELHKHMNQHFVSRKIPNY